jgi:hypothetical protein
LEEADGDAERVFLVADAENLQPIIYVPAPVCLGGLGASLVDRNPRERLARSPAALLDLASVEAIAATVGPNPVINLSPVDLGFSCGEVLR